MKIPERATKKRKPNKIKRLCEFDNIKCWFDKTDRTIRFRPSGRKRKTDFVSISQIYDMACGQLKLL